MDKRFLFQGKREDYGSWVVGYYVYNFWKKNETTIHMPDGGCCTVDPSTVGQCTGLTAAKSYRGDKPEDLLIYEGDICIDSLGWVFEVIWDNDNARFIGRHSKSRGDTYVCYIGRQPKVEIIGNIHDHPELLNADKGRD